MARTRSRANARQKTLALPDGLSAEALLDIYATMVLVRTLDERVWMMNRQGKAAIVASCQGHEAAQLGSVWAVREHTQDQFFFTYYRDMAVFVAQGLSPLEVMLGYLAKEGEPLSGARQFPTHGAYPEHGIVNLSNVVSTQLPQAVGAALAARMRGEDTVVIAYFGDGGASVGDCHEAMNFAGVHRLPVIFFCENNKYAISVPLSQQMAIDSVASRAQGYGFPGAVVDGCDIVAVYESTFEAARRARSGDGPTLIEAMVERYLPHTTDDDDSRYRAREELEEARKRDPLVLLRDQLTALGALTEERDSEFSSAAKREVNEATDAAEAAPYPETDGFYRHVYSSGGAEGGAPSQ